MRRTPECFLDCMEIDGCKGCTCKHNHAPCYNNNKREYFKYDE